MKQNLLEIITKVIEIAWRRRLLLTLPIAITLALSALASLWLPRTYVTKALLAMQESGSDNPLIKSSGSSERVRDRAPGLQALLKSDRVLINALRDILGSRMPSDPRRVALALRDLDSALSFEMIGSDFLVFQLKSNSPAGLGHKLEAITARFLESLVATDQDSMSATQVLLDKRREDLNLAEKALLRYMDQLGERAVAAIAANDVRLKAQQSALPALTTDLDVIDAQIGTLKATLGAAAAPANAGRRESEIREAIAAAEAADKQRTPTAQSEAPAARDRAALLNQLQTLETRGATLRRDFEQTTTAVADLSKAAADGRSPEGQLRRLQRDVTDARALLDSYTKRFPMALNSRSLQVLNAPERIRVIDAPRDPEFATSSRTRIVIGGLALGLLLSAGLVAGAEMLDQRLRSASDFEAASGAPVIARLPPALPELDASGQATGQSLAGAMPSVLPESQARSAAASTEVTFARRTAA